MRRHSCSLARPLQLAAVAAPALAALALAAPSPAPAAPLTLGQVTPAGATVEECDRDVSEVLAAKTAGANPYVVPAEGLITSWSMMATRDGSRGVGLRIFRPVPNPAGSYKIVAQDEMRDLDKGKVGTFSTSIPVLAGDVIGIGTERRPSHVGCMFSSGNGGDVTALREERQAAAVGSTVAIPATHGGWRPNIAATLLPRPQIASLTPPAGPVAGGTEVRIRGQYLDGATAVAFGDVKAGFTVVSSTEIVTTTPPWTDTESVDVTVTVGTQKSVAARYEFDPSSPSSASTDSGFSWTVSLPPLPDQGPPSRGIANCVVPKLLGKKLSAARRSLERANCVLGLLSGSRMFAKARVKRQAPREGRTFAPGSSVDVTLALPKQRPR